MPQSTIRSLLKKRFGSKPLPKENRRPDEPEWMKTHPKAWKIIWYLTELGRAKLVIVDSLGLRFVPAISGNEYKYGWKHIINHLVAMMIDAEDELFDLISKDLIDVPVYEHSTSTKRID